jgi:threonine/homoserine/homoserine lactone efflux protein
MFLFLKGLIIGFSIAAPVGPIGLLCIHRSLNNGFKVGLLTGLGAATADAIYGFIAAFGLTAVSTFLISSKLWIQILGGLFLIYLGSKLLFSTTRKEQKEKEPFRKPVNVYGSTLLLTLTNPTTILSFIAVFAGLGVGLAGSDYVQAASVVGGVFIGSALWWLLLSGGIAYILHGRINKQGMQWINRISASIIIVFGLFAMWSAYK